MKGAFDMAKEKKNTVSITFRAPVDVIRSEYDKICGNPQLNKLLLQMREITDTLKHMNDCSSVSGVLSDDESGVDGDL